MRGRAPVAPGGADDERVAESARSVQDIHVPGMQQVEDSIGEDDGSVLRAPPGHRRVTAEDSRVRTGGGQ
jgi:hypothetical protein